MASVLITGIAGSLAQLAAHRLSDAGHEVVGVDFRPVQRFLKPKIRCYRANYNKTLIEDVVRKHRPTHVLHLGRVGNLKEGAKRFDLNVVGSAKIMELCLKYEVQRLVVLSTYHIYGAHPHNHIPIFEDEPLRARQSIPQLGDAVQLDNMACTWIYRHRKLKTVVLRPCNIVGPNIRNSISTYLRQPAVVYLVGFSPMWQFIYESDMVEAILLAVFGKKVGIYNVTGAGALPLIESLKLTQARMIPLPGPLADLAIRLGRRISSSVPPYLLDFLRYPCVISGTKFTADFAYRPEVGIEQTLRATVRRI